MSIESTWTREATSKLIELYKRTPSLYAVNSPDYYNRNMRQFHIESIAKNEELLALRPSTTAAHVKKKMNGLRTQFLKAESLIIESKCKSGSDCEASYVPTLWCFKKLGFLSQHTKNFSSMTNMPAPNDYDSEGNNLDTTFEPEIAYLDEEDDDEEDYKDNVMPLQYETPATSITSKASKDQRGKKRKFSDSVSDEILREASQALKRVASVSPAPTPSKIDIFLQFIGADLKEIQSKTILRAIQNKIILDVGKALEEDEKNRS